MIDMKPGQVIPFGTQWKFTFSINDAMCTSNEVYDRAADAKEGMRCLVSRVNPGCDGYILGFSKWRIERVRDALKDKTATNGHINRAADMLDVMLNMGCDDISSVDEEDDHEAG